MKNENIKLTINRSLLFAFSFVGTFLTCILAIIQGTFLNGWIMFFTEWSNIFVFVWASLWLANLMIKNEKIDKVIGNWWFQGTATLMIFITGLVYNLYLVPDSINTIGFKPTIIAYFGFSFCEHLLVPIFMVRDFFLTKGLDINIKSKKEFSLKILISTIVPIVWLLLSILLIRFAGLTPQYPFMHLFDVSSTELAINIVILLIVAIIWISGFIFILWYSNKKNKAEKETKK